MNLHAPERLTGETQQQYRERRAASRASAMQVLRGHKIKPRSNPDKNAKRNARRATYAANNGQRPKFPALRVHKQAKHPLTDENGAYTLIGANSARKRMWLGGISAQRGY